MRNVIQFIKKAHEGQKRSDGSPYWQHPERVVRILKVYGVDDYVTLAAAWCHDVVEDTNHNLEDIENLFSDVVIGKQVRKLVKQLTNKCSPGTPFCVRQDRLLQHCRQMEAQAKFVKLADRLDNLLDMGDCWESGRQLRYAKAALELVIALLPIPPEAQRLCEVVQLTALRVVGNLS